MKEIFHFNGFVRTFFNLSAKFSLPLSVKMCEQFLVRPKKLALRSFQFKLIHKAQSTYVNSPEGLRVKIWRWKNSGPRVLFSHGWSGNVRDSPEKWGGELAEI